MPPKIITSELVKKAQAQSPKRRRFSDNPVVVKRQDGSCMVSPKFHSIDHLFEVETGLITNGGPYGPYLQISRKRDIERVLRWQDQRSNLVFLRDLLDSSIALDYNLRDHGVYTGLGRAEHDAKAGADEKAVSFLVDECCAPIQSLATLRACDTICAVPPSPSKGWDLPTTLAKRIAAKVGKTDISASVKFTKEKGSVKALSLDEKWGALEKGKLKIWCDVKNKKVVLIDDKYQSGTTAQFVAGRLYEAGAAEVHGIYCVKTWRDTDNK